MEKWEWKFVVGKCSHGYLKAYIMPSSEVLPVVVLLVTEFDIFRDFSQKHNT